MKSFKLSDYFKIVNPEYVFYKLTPVKSIRNYNSDKIIKAISSLYRNVTQRIVRANGKYFFTAPCKVSYYIYFTNKVVEFYFIVPKDYQSLLIDKIGDTWRGITIQKVDSVPDFGDGCIKKYLTYKQHDALSLSADKRNNYLLSSLLSTLDVLEDDDRIGIFYNFIPVSQSGWMPKFDEIIQNLKAGVPVEKNKLSVAFCVKYVLNLILNIADTALEALGAEPKKDTQTIKDLALLPETLKKRNERIVGAQLLVLSESPNTLRAHNNASSICESYKSIAGDNELIDKRYVGQFNPTSLRIKGAETVKLSPAEGQNLLSLPGYELLQEHKIISCVDVCESPVPAELQQGTICVGTNTYKGKSTKAYLTTDKEYKNLSLVIIGPTRAGKTTFISNFANDSVRAGECTILFDFCKRCELSDEVSSAVKCNVLNIDCENFEQLQGLGYNEVSSNEADIFKQYRNAKMQTMQLIVLVDSITTSSDLSSRMGRYLECAAMVVFINGGSIKQVFDCLQDSAARCDAIKNVPLHQLDNLQEYVNGLRELDDDKSGTRYHLVSGIMDRVQRLKQNAYMELMLKKDCSRNFNLLNEIQRPQLICLRMPDSMFPTEPEKDTFCTYWLTKIWLALQLRGRDVPRDKCIKVNIVIDELSQVPRCQDFLRSKLSQIAKFDAKIVLSCHYLQQIEIIRNELKAANSSYMLIAGCDKDNYKELRDELQPYTVEDLLNLKRYHSLNYLKTYDRYATFVTKLPAPL